MSTPYERAVIAAGRKRRTGPPSQAVIEAAVERIRVAGDKRAIIEKNRPPAPPKPEE